MPFEFAKISDHGTDHPVIARLHLQTFNLLNACAEELREPVKQVYFHAAFRLVHCFDVLEELSRKQTEAEAEIQPSSDPRVTYRPSVIGLGQLVEGSYMRPRTFCAIYPAFSSRSVDLNSTRQLHLVHVHLNGRRLPSVTTTV